MNATKSPVQAIVFDLDGVLIDSEPLWDDVRRGLADESGRAWPNDATRLMQGMSTTEWSTYLTSVVGIPGSPAVVAGTVIDRMVARYSAGPPLLPGAVEVVTALAARWPLGLASSSPRRLIDAVLADIGLTSSFAVTVSTEAVPRGKPAPDVYLAVVEQLAIESGRTVAAGRTVAIEDSSNGIRAAAAAGLRVVAVPQSTYPPAVDALALASWVASDLTEVTVDRVEGLA